jgi:hypothetical protein
MKSPQSASNSGATMNGGRSTSPREAPKQAKWLFEKLPTELWLIIAELLPIDSTASLGLCSYSFWAIFDRNLQLSQMLSPNPTSPFDLGAGMDVWMFRVGRGRILYWVDAYLS